MDRFDGKRLSRPNDVVCKSDGSVYFTNPGLRIPLGERELDPSSGQPIDRHSTAARRPLPPRQEKGINHGLHG